jgi:hypothetical protein
VPPGFAVVAVSAISNVDTASPCLTLENSIITVYSELYLLTRVSYLIVPHFTAAVSHHKAHFMNLSVNCITLHFSMVFGHVEVLKILDYINFKNM